MGITPMRRVRTWLAALTSCIVVVVGLGLAPAVQADDTFAPVPVAVSTTPHSIAAGGQASSRVTLQASGPISDVYVLFRNTATGKLHTQMTQGSYSAADSTYTFEIFFAQGTPPGTYLAQYLQIQTTAGQEFGYWRDGSLIHNPGNLPDSGTAAVALNALDFNYITPVDLDRPHTSGSYRAEYWDPYTMSLFIRDSWGRLGLFPTGGNGTWKQAYEVGSGWNIFNLMFSAGDFNNDGENDVIARDGAGSLFLYPADGQGGWYPRQQIGWGWGIFTSVFAAGDFSGDGNNDLLARKPSGELVLYPGNGSGSFLGATTIGWGWSGMTSVFSPGDFNGDHKPDVLARDGAGNLHFYGGNGSGGWTTSGTIGQGWNAITKLGGAGDFDGDGANDVWGIDTSGQMRMYYGNGSGGWKSSGVVGWGWGGFNAVF
ncbi:VCBS repeat-containing protein [Paenarthrobacter sp. OM7]|uniref:FG-GAP repeat domain-containing protein n=1 Tax=Paenarthrobacter sp. AMU7 TaxID=3162492 RepID=A0AB39YP84_9MICC|nr:MULTISPECIES: VCBS repeat-containing protein [Micrococcaceae]WGM20151.1 VCBS repeat-containing protein [Paenarthrobacter sp. OM7]